MKKMISIFMVTIFLAGCEVPFMGSDKEEVIAFINSNATVISASAEIDKTLVERLEKAEEEKLDFEKLKHEVRKSREMQEELYDNIEYDNTLMKHKVKNMYLHYIKQKIISYNILMGTIDKEDYETLAIVLEEHKIKDKEITAKMIRQINDVLVSYEEKERKSLEEVPKTKK